MRDDWEDVKEPSEQCSPSNGWCGMCGMCGNCCEHAHCYMTEIATKNRRAGSNEPASTN